MGKPPPSEVVAAELDVVEIDSPDAAKPRLLQEVSPTALVVLLDLLVRVMVIDVLLEVVPGITTFLADTAVPTVALDHFYMGSPC